MIWYAHPFKEFLQFVVLHTVKGLLEVDAFSGNPCFFYDPGLSLLKIKLIIRLKVCFIPTKDFPITDTNIFKDFRMKEIRNFTSLTLIISSLL